MKRCSIIIHSVSGNCFIIGNYLKELMAERNVDARLYRVDDPDLHIWANTQETTNEFYEDICELPLVGPRRTDPVRKHLGGDEDVSRLHAAAQQR